MESAANTANAIHANQQLYQQQFYQQQQQDQNQQQQQQQQQTNTFSMEDYFKTLALLNQTNTELFEKTKELQEMSSATQAEPAVTNTSSTASSSNDSKVVWMGNLNSELTQEALVKELIVYGQIDSIKYTPTKGCVIVKYNDPKNALEAYNTVKDKGILGSSVHVEWSKFDLADESVPPSRTNWVGNVLPDVTEDELHRLFSKYGTVLQIKLIPQSKCAFVNFTTVDEAKMARLCLDGSSLHGKNIKINFGKDSSSSTLNNNNNFHHFNNNNFYGNGNPNAGVNDVNHNSQYPHNSLRHNRPNDVTNSSNDNGRGGGGGQQNEEIPSSFIRAEDLPIQAPDKVPPDDVVNVINSFVAKLLSKGVEFEVIAIKSNNPKISFINPWDQYHQYYKWKVFTEWEKLKKSNVILNSDINNNTNNYQHHQQQQQVFTNEDLTYLNDLLLKLIPGKKSIRTTQEWVVSKAFGVHAICDTFATFVRSHDHTFPRILSVLYLINDILHTPQSRLFADHLATTGILLGIFEAATRAAVTQRERWWLEEVVDVWEGRSLLPHQVLGTIRRMCEDMTFRSMPPQQLIGENNDYKRLPENGYYHNDDYLHPSYPKREKFN